ncbi:hypothetical protein BJ508DRAFT_126437 [Ascobolus immersus RN42]|uniref:Uncharacterized protein n=1 Tax=Ascobolus immersus RN42 TaxID=1160509 RepID=A0A3N4I8V1_ASCIM|nr:hypothetical protein BJ508DRAFT_126437 [Ascobolus immersus RN42]
MTVSTNTVCSHFQQHPPRSRILLRISLALPWSIVVFLFTLRVLQFVRRLKRVAWFSEASEKLSSQNRCKLLRSGS